jgi:hypothetical protein
VPDPPRYCVACRYPCTALPRDRACPECGHAAPPADAIVVQGYSFARNPALWLILVVAFLVLSVAMGVLSIVAPSRGFPIVSFLGNLAVMIPVGIRAFHAWRLYRQGGDITWFVESTSVDVITPSGTRTVRWSDVEYVTIERGGVRHLARLSFHGDGALGASVWLDERHYEVYGLRTLLKSRVADARAAAGRPPPPEPTGTPRFARYEPERPGANPR